MRYLVILILVLIGTGFYLNRSYHQIFSYLDKPLVTPKTQMLTIIPSAMSKQSLKYAAIGDSLTAGVGADKYEQAWPYLVAQKLEAGEGRVVSLLNVGQPGAKVADTLGWQLEEVKKFEPELITVLIGTNDAFDRVSAKDYKEKYTQLLQTLKETKAKIVLIKVPYLGASNLILLPYNWYFDRQIKKYNEVIDGLAKQNDLEIVDLYSQNKRFVSEHGDFYSADLLHPSAVGYGLWAQAIGEVLLTK